MCFHFTRMHISQKVKLPRKCFAEYLIIAKERPAVACAKLQKHTTVIMGKFRGRYMPLPPIPPLFDSSGAYDPYAPGLDTPLWLVKKYSLTNWSTVNYIYYWCPKMQIFLLHFQNVKYFNTAISILDFSLLLSIKL